MAASRNAPPPRLLADIGGTTVRFALQRGDRAAGRFVALRGEDYPDLAAAVRAYLERSRPARPPRQAAFAIASPVDGDRVEMTNSPWSFSIRGLRRRLGLERLLVINDFTAVALAVPRLARRNLVKVGPGAAARGAPIAVIGPGTGLGVSGLIPAGGGWVPLSAEGGHVTLAPADDRESEIVARLRRRFGHVSAERAISGPGLVNLYLAIAELEGRPAVLDDPAEITRQALDGGSPLCAAALATFCALLGGCAGDLALTLGARGGVYVAGGIVPRLGEAFAGSPFRRRFEAKGRFADYLAAIPTFVVTHRSPAFLGLRALLDAEA